MQEFRERLAAAMREKGIRASRLASETGLSPARISQYLHGVYQPKGDAILRLAEALGVSAMWLMGEDCPMTASAPAGASAGLPDNLLPLQLRRYPLLGQAVEIPQLNDHPLPFRQTGDRLPQSDFLHHPFFRFRVRQNVFQREAFVPRFSLNRLRGGGGRFGQGDFFRGKPGLTGNFLNRRFPAQRPGQAAAGGLDGRGLLF